MKKKKIEDFFYKHIPKEVKNEIEKELENITKEQEDAKKEKEDEIDNLIEDNFLNNFEATKYVISRI